MSIQQFDFPCRLALLMQEKALTKYRVAKDLHCAPSTITNWLNGKRPNDLTLERIAEYFDVSVEYLKGETDERKREAPAPEGERVTQETKDALMQAARTSIMIEAFEKLPVEAQNEAIGRILLEVQNLRLQGNQK